MPITKTQQPYEFLVRWTDGKISGAHVKFLETVREDGTVLTVREGDAIPVSLAGEQGYPIADIFAAIQSGAIAAAQSAMQAISDAQTSEETAKAAHDDVLKAEAERKAQAEQAAADAKAAADAAEAEATRLQDALAAQVAAERAAQEKAAFAAAVAARVAEQLAAQQGA